MKTRFEPEALTELIDAMNYLDAERPGAGNELQQEVNIAIRTIEDAPARWPTIFRDVRRYLVHRFKYQVIYQVLGQEIRVVAVMHTRRRPGYWRKRL